MSSTNRAGKPYALQLFVEPRDKLLQQNPSLQTEPGLSHVNRVSEQVGISRQLCRYVKVPGVIFLGERLEDTILERGHPPHVRVAGWPIRTIEKRVQILMS